MTTDAAAGDRARAALPACFHCELPIPAGAVFHARIDGIERAMCCPGCVAVAELIDAGGMSAYYRFRDQPAANPQAATPTDSLLRYDLPELQRTFVSVSVDGTRTAAISVHAMRCAACVWLLEQHLMAQPGVREVRASLAGERLTLTWDERQTRLSVLLAAILQLGYGAHPYRRDWQESARRDEYRAALRRLAVAGLGSMQVMMFSVGLYAGALQGIEDSYRDLLRWVSAIVTAPIVAYAARPFFEGARRSLRARQIGMDVPISVAIVIAFVASLYATLARTGEVYFDSVAMFVFFLSIGRFVDMRARHRAAATIDAALRHPPESATRVSGGRHETVSVFELAAGDRVLVRPGESIPADGCVLEGCGWVNEAVLTGEQWPREKRPRDAVVGGTLNGESPLVVEVQRTGGDTVLSTIAAMVARAADSRPAVARLADRVARVFVPASLGVAAAVLAAWWPIDHEHAVWNALAVLVVTCPCALSLATPAALTAAAGGLLRRGLLLTQPHALEALVRATHVVFDKTGTLTRGSFRIGRVAAMASLSRDASLAIAAALERHSEHPIARAFTGTGPGTVVEKSVPGTDFSLHASEVTATAGAGVEGTVGGRRYRIGAPAWVAELAGSPLPASLSDPAVTAVLLGDEQRLLCRFELEDEARPEAAPAVARLKALGLHVELLSGDTTRAVERLARRVGIEHATGSATPSSKLERIHELQRQGAVVVMVGDGVNDAPGLGAAHVSIAMGGGTDLAMSRADGVLLSEDLGALPAGIAHARAARSVMRQNLAWSALYNLVALPLAAIGWITPYWAAIGMSLSSLVVVLNAVRLGRAASPETSASTQASDIAAAHAWKALPEAGS